MKDQPWLERIFDDRGASFLVDTRSPEEAANHVEREQKEKKAELAQLETSTAYFDEDGVCRMVAEGSAPVEGFAHSRPVAWGTRPNDVTLNLATGRVNKSKAPTVAIPEAVPLGEPVVIALPDGVVAEVDGERHRGSLTIDASTAGRKLRVELHGRERATFDVEVRGYAEERKAAYPPIEDQLDALWKGGAEAEAMRAQVAAVKAAHPKPDPEKKT
jgi:hypothetical protein